MISMDQARTLQGKALMGSGGEKLGTIDTLYADRDGGEPTFATVHTGLFGSKTSFVPLSEASMSGDGVTVPYDKDLVKSAPSIDPDAELEPAEEERIYQHYGVGGGAAQYATETTDTTTTGRTVTERDGDGVADDVERRGFTDRDGDGVADDVQGRTVGHDTSGPTTDEAMTRSEERLRVGTEKVETGRARLRKFITTETETRTVPVSREQVRVEREPITDANRDKAYSGGDLTEEEHEVVLTEERPVVQKETVAVERVRLDTDTVTEDVTVNEDVRKEQIEMDGDTASDIDLREATTARNDR